MYMQVQRQSPEPHKLSQNTPTILETDTLAASLIDLAKR
ncbi:hypothetical protein M595_4891 [Lyngbya aestuarii BL J]|uniref:Uncharacterized protein n=1 Tax=Lyngbya aestuarii BL J TaxID=1348334 RepID=U7QBE1_9CYAN|nr:hypothetical protein M595_4891 [Lyngbya aestuarii BL J]